MSQFGPDETLDAHITAQAAARFGLGDLINYGERQYKVIAYKPQPDGTVIITMTPTGNQATEVVPKSTH